MSFMQSSLAVGVMATADEAVEMLSTKQLVLEECKVMIVLSLEKMLVTNDFHIYYRSTITKNVLKRRAKILKIVTTHSGTG